MVVALLREPGRSGRTLDLAAQRLRDNGWHVYPPVAGEGDDRCDAMPLSGQTAPDARCGDTIQQLLPGVESGGDGNLRMCLYRATPPAGYPAGGAGGLGRRVGAVPSLYCSP